MIGDETYMVSHKQEMYILYSNRRTQFLAKGELLFGAYS